MPQATGLRKGAIRDSGLGIVVEKATAALPQTTTATLFTVSGGRVILRGLLGEATVLVQTQVNNAKLISTPTVGTAIDICAVKDITALEVGGKLVLPAAVATAFQQFVAGAAVLQPNWLVVAIGNIQLNCSASSTGSLKWSLWYTPLDPGARVAAA